ncbi:hypothetical protein CCP3SC5AM1_1800002 [Gammaproteobacteria bacterium]
MYNLHTKHHHRVALSKRLIILVSLLAILAGLIHERMAVPCFRAESLIQINGPVRNGQVMNFPLLENWIDLFAGERLVAPEVEMRIRSSRLIGRVVDDLHLVRSGVSPCALLNLNKVSARWPDEWASIMTFFGLDDQIWGQRAELSRPETIESLRQRVEITEKPRGSGLIAVALQDRDSAWAIKVVDGLIAEYLRLDRVANDAQVKKLEEILERQLALLKDRLDISIIALDHFRITHGFIDFFQESERLREKMATVEKQIKQLAQKSEEVTFHFGSGHAMVNALDARIAQLTLEQTALTQRLASLPNAWLELTRLSREVEMDAQLYFSQLNQAQALKNQEKFFQSVRENRQDSDSISTLPLPRIITPAVATSVPVYPTTEDIIRFVLMGWVLIWILAGYLGREKPVDGSINVR